MMVRTVLFLGASPPARVAWIETCKPGSSAPVHSVATREGGVDRNMVRNGIQIGVV